MHTYFNIGVHTDIHTSIINMYLSIYLLMYSGQAGAVDEETFLTAFEDVPSVNLFSAKDLEEQMKIIRENVGDDKKDWKQRTESVCAEIISF